MRGKNDVLIIEGFADGSGEDSWLYVAPQLWIYFAAAAPLTLVVVFVMWFWGRKKRSKGDVEGGGLESVEKDIVAQLRRQNGHAKTA